MKQIQFQKIDWHDGNIIDFQYIFPLKEKAKPKIILTAEVYPANNPRPRYKIQVEFQNIQKTIKNIDFKSLKNNVVAGSINYINQKDITLDKKTFQEYTFTLFGGKIKIVSARAIVKKL